MKFLIPIVFLLFSMPTVTFAQDFIVLKTGSEIKSKVVEITPNEVKYKTFDNLDGPIITIEKATVFMLRYANGKTEVVNPITTEKVESPKVEKVETRLNTPIEPKPTPSVSTLPKKKPLDMLDSTKGFTGCIFMGGSLPLGSFANKNVANEEKAGGAKLGFNGGVQVGYRFNERSSLLCEVQFDHNNYEIQVADVRNIYALTGEWTQVNILASMKYEYPVTQNVRFYLMPSLGLSIVSIKGDFADVLKYLNAKTQTTAFAYATNLGFVFNKQLNLGIGLSSADPVFGDYKPNILKLQATIGYQF